MKEAKFAVREVEFTVKEMSSPRPLVTEATVVNCHFQSSLLLLGFNFFCHLLQVLRVCCKKVAVGIITYQQRIGNFKGCNFQNSPYLDFEMGVASKMSWGSDQSTGCE